jgi:hypothetical protein
MQGAIQSISRGGTTQMRHWKKGQQRQVKTSPTGDERTTRKVAARNRTAYLFGVGFFLYLWFLGINFIGQVIVALQPAGHRAIERTDLVTSLSYYAFPLLGCLVFLWVVVQGTKPVFAARDVL